MTLLASKVLGSDDEIACIIGHEAGHALGPETIEPGHSQPMYMDENYADTAVIGVVMKSGYDARACPIVLRRMMGEFSQPGLPAGGVYRWPSCESRKLPSRLAVQLHRGPAPVYSRTRAENDASLSLLLQRSEVLGQHRLPMTFSRGMRDPTNAKIWVTI